jgi:hypothetical protein
MLGNPMQTYIPRNFGAQDEWGGLWRLFLRSLALPRLPLRGCSMYVYVYVYVYMD